jgi:hypothetical protein
MATTLKEQIVEKLEEVPEAELSELMDFLEFLTWKAQQTPISKTHPVSAANAIRALRGHGQGEQLVQRLLQSRQRG